MKTLFYWIVCSLVLFVAGCISEQQHQHARIELSNGLLPFKEYDEAIISTVENRWDRLFDIDGVHPIVPRFGKVVVSFRLHSDGKVSDLKETENSSGNREGLMCQSAILNSAPFPKWPSDLRVVLAKDYREVTFVFYYN
jgi:hypothetical protein